jgi:hypothetical protein
MIGLNGTMINLVTKNKTIKMEAKTFEGELKNTENGWVIQHSIIDPYGQIPNPIPLHPSDNENLIDGKEVEFYVGYEYFAKIK